MVWNEKEVWTIRSIHRHTHTTLPINKSITHRVSHAPLQVLRGGPRELVEGLERCQMRPDFGQGGHVLVCGLVVGLLVVGRVDCSTDVGSTNHPGNRPPRRCIRNTTTPPNPTPINNPVSSQSVTSHLPYARASCAGGGALPPRCGAASPAPTAGRPPGFGLV